MNACALTLPGHEPDLAPVIRDVLWEIEKSFGRPVDTDRVIATVLEQHRRHGIPAVRGYFEGQAIVVEIATPAGVG